MQRALREQGAPTMAGMEGGVWFAEGVGFRRGFAVRNVLLAFAASAVLLLEIHLVVMGGFVPPGGIVKPSREQADLITFREALSMYELQTGNLPTTEQGLKALWEKPTTSQVPTEWRRIMSGEIDDPWGHPYQYRNPGQHNPKGYDVYSMGPDGIAGTADDIGNWAKPPNGGAR